MKKRYITVTGFDYYFGQTPFKVGKKVKCTKEPENIFDSEAIKVTKGRWGLVGYVANSVSTTANGTMSAGRIYDSVGDSFYAKVMFMTQSKVICKVLEEKREKMPGNMKDKYEKIEI